MAVRAVVFAVAAGLAAGLAGWSGEQNGVPPGRLAVLGGGTVAVGDPVLRAGENGAPQRQGRMLSASDPRQVGRYGVVRR